MQRSNLKILHFVAKKVTKQDLDQQVSSGFVK